MTSSMTGSLAMRWAVELQQLLGRGVDPVRVLDDGQDRTHQGQRHQPIEKGTQRPCLALLGREGERRVAPCGRQRQQIGEERHQRRAVAGPSGHQRLELGELLLGRVAQRDARRVLELGQHGMEGAARAMRGALIDEGGASLPGDMVAQRVGEP